jgi:hypothetical protein
MLQTPPEKIHPEKSRIPREKHTKPSWHAYLKTSTTHFSRRELSLIEHRKTTHQTAFAPEKGSTIHLQQFSHGPVKSGT